MDLEVDEASPFADIYQAEVIFSLSFDTVESVDEVDCAFPKTLKSSPDTCMVLMRQVQWLQKLLDLWHIQLL
jgi:hypothetical protein